MRGTPAVRSTSTGTARSATNKRVQRCEASELPPSTPKRARLNSDTFTFFDQNTATRKTRELGLNFNSTPKKTQQAFRRSEDSLLQISTPKHFLNSDGVVSLDREKRANETSKAKLNFNKTESKIQDSSHEDCFLTKHARNEAISLVHEIFDEKITPKRQKISEKVPSDTIISSDSKTKSSKAISSDFESKHTSHVLESEDWKRRKVDQLLNQVKNDNMSSTNEALRETIENQNRKIKIIENQLEKQSRNHSEAENAIKDLAQALKAETQHSVTRSRTTSLMSIETSSHSLRAQVDDYKWSPHIASLSSNSTSESISKQLSRARFNAAQLVLKLTEAYEEIRRLRKIVDDNQIKSESSLSTSAKRVNTNLFNWEM